MSTYPPRMSLRPIEAWPGTFTKPRWRSTFNASWSSTLTLLDHELRHLSTRKQDHPSTVLQLAMREQDFRLDGLPRANAKPEHPGVILSIESKHGPLSYPCDKFTTWQDNLRAIALALEALRRVDRYGITARGEQYTGWKALGASEPLFADASTAEQFLRDQIGIHESADRRKVIRLARAFVHPDRPAIHDEARVRAINAAIRRLEELS